MSPRLRVSAVNEPSQVAVGLIAAADGRVLLQLRDDKPGLSGRNQWGFFGGHLDPGETPEQALLREMQEELGWRPRHFERYATRAVNSEGWSVASHAFAAHLDVAESLLALGEGQALGLFAVDALPDRIVPSNAPLLREFAASDAYKRVKRRWDIITATALLVGRDGRFLLQHRDDRPDIANPGRWGSFGGAIEPYETPDQGFLRELEEELAWVPSSYALHASYPYDLANRPQLIYVYTALVDVPREQLVLGEGQGMDFFAPDALPAATVPELAALIERFAQASEYRALIAAEAR